MKIRIRNVDIKPYRVEFDLLETSTPCPHLRIGSAGYVMDRLRGLPTGGTLASLTIRPGPSVDILLLSEEMIPKKSTGKTEIILKPSKESPKQGLFKKLFTKQTPGGEVKFKISNKKSEEGIETNISEKDSRLSLVNGNTNIVSINLTADGRMLDIFLMNGTIWLVDEVNKEMCIMSSERNFDVDTKRFTYYDTPF